MSLSKIVTGLMDKYSYGFVSFQALDGDFSDDNRNRCRVATTPLLEAVENLSTFANNPEFASIPAQISNEVFPRLAQFRAVVSILFLRLLIT